MPKLHEIIGHAGQLAQLQSDLAHDNVSHAYLFSGPRHLGKFYIALNFAKDLLQTDDHSIESLLHPDLLVLDMLWMEGVHDDWDEIAKHSNVPQVHRKKKRVKTDAIGIDDIRALHDRLIETGSSGKYRVCIIRSVERMQDAAANAFLKILEEPPAGLVFLLTTQAQGRLLPTIISRARVVPFRRVSRRDIALMLQDLSEDDRAFISHIAEGAPGMVQQLKSDPDLLRTHRSLHSTAQSFWRSQSLSERLRVLTPLHKRGVEADDLLLHLGLALREQSDAIKKNNAHIYAHLTRNLQTNAHRQLLVQDFALKLY